MSMMNIKITAKMPNIFSSITFFLVNLCLSSGIVLQRPVTWPASSASGESTDIKYSTHYVKQQVDHFSFDNKDTFLQRYLVADQFWDPENGPIFFYTGNEGDIAWFCNNTGLMWDWAPEFQAMLIFAEHRYYGESLPYGKDSFKNSSYTGYLSAEQALADFAVLISQLRTFKPGVATKPFVAFGGSYGGMLAAWFRIKYPHMVQGALAASAPVWMFGDLVPCEAFYQTVTADFQRGGEHCTENIASAWEIITTQGKTASGRKSLAETFSLCDSLSTASDVDILKGWLSEAYSNLAMVDYPYPANFLEPLPAWPISVVCQPLSHEKLHGNDLLKALSAAMKVYYNYTGNSPCLGIKHSATANLGELGWGFQACTEMVMPLCSDGKNDMFEPSPWNYQSYAEQCKKQWGVTPRPNWILEQFGGKAIEAASNIIFSNGNLDPWHVGGVLSNISRSLIAIHVPDGAHHLDLRSATASDPPELTAVRQREKAIVRGWLTQDNNDNRIHELEEQLTIYRDKERGISKVYEWIEKTSRKEDGIFSLVSDADTFTVILCLLLLIIVTFYLYMSVNMEQLLQKYLWKKSNESECGDLLKDDSDYDEMDYAVKA